MIPVEPTLVAAMLVVLLLGVLIGPRRVIPGALILATFFLPADTSVEIPGPIPTLDKFGVVFFPSLLLLLISPREVRKVRFNYCDYAMGLFALGTMATNAMAGRTPYEMGSRFIDLCIFILAPYLAGRVWLNDREQLLYFARVGANCVLISLPFMLLEMAQGPFVSAALFDTPPILSLPRLGGIYRSHMMMTGGALGMGSICALLLGLLVIHRRQLKAERQPPAKGLNLRINILAFAVLASLSRGPLVGALMVVAFPLIFGKRTWIVATLIGLSGVFFFLWMVFNQSAYKVTGWLGLGSSGLGGTLAYRFLQIDVYSRFVQSSPWFGYGLPIPRDIWVPIIDGILLLRIMESGLLGVGLYAGWMVAMFHRIGQWAERRPTLVNALGMAFLAQMGWLLFSAWGDSFITSLHLFLGGGLITAAGQQTGRGSKEPGLRR